MRVPSLHIASVAFLAAVWGVGLAQPHAEVTVAAPHVERSSQTGPMGRNLPAMSISYKVSYADLNLATHSGAVELENRIREYAGKACEQLAKLYPETTEGNPPCVEGAVKSAMAQASKAIAAAEVVAKK
jgi:UrcA family protein